MKNLVTGGGGFIGSHVVRALLDDGEEVRVLLRPGEDERNLAGLQVERVTGDVLDAESVRRAVRGCRRVFHLAAVYALWLPRMEHMRQVNVEGTRTVLTAALESGVERVVYTSSIAVFGGQGLDRDATEESPFRLGDTGNLYARTKFESHQVALEFAGRGLLLTLVAPCGPIGPGDLGPTPTGRFLLALVNAPFVPRVETVSCFGDVRDMARGHVLAATRGKSGECYLLGTENLWYRDLARLVEDATGVRKPGIPVPDPVLSAAGHAMKWLADLGWKRPPLLTPDSVRIGRLGLRADCSKARRDLGLPQTPLRRAVRDALAWFAANGYIRDARLRRRLAAESARSCAGPVNAVKS